MLALVPMLYTEFVTEAARSAKARTKAGTLDRRTFEEHIRHVEGIGAVDPGTTAGSHDKSSPGMATLASPIWNPQSSPGGVANRKTECILSEMEFHEKHFVLTTLCIRLGLISHAMSACLALKSRIWYYHDTATKSPVGIYQAVEQRHPTTR